MTCMCTHSHDQVHRVGLMGSRGVQMMARQTLVGNDYALIVIGDTNDAYEAHPDYFATVLIRILVGNT
jgi:hypothetical protein